MYSAVKSDMSLMKQRFVIIHTIRQSEIPGLLGSSVTNKPSVNMLCLPKNCLFLHFHKIVTCLHVGQLGIGQVFFESPAKLCIGGL